MTPQEIEQIIDMLIEKLGPIGGQVWSIYVRQVYVNAFGSMLWMILLLIGAVVAFYWLRRGISRYRSGSQSDNTIAMLVGGGIGLGWCLFFAFGTFTFGVLKILNPEYYAIQMLLGR